MPTLTLSGMVARVTFPVFSAIQDDRARLKRGLKKALSTLVLFNFPVMIGLAVIAHPLVVLLLTEKWSPSVPYVQLLCVAGLLFPLHMMNLNVLQALGRSDLFLRLEVVKKILIVLNIAVTWRWGISAMIAGIVVNSVISFFLNSYYNGSLIGYGPGEQLQDLFPYLAASVLMGSTVYAAGLLPFSHHWSRLLAQVAAGIVVYAFLCRLFRLKAFMSAWEAVWDRTRFVRAKGTN
jgi:teichuronic acid exporter